MDRVLFAAIVVASATLLFYIQSNNTKPRQNHSSSNDDPSSESSKVCSESTSTLYKNESNQVDKKYNSDDIVNVPPITPESSCSPSSRSSTSLDSTTFEGTNNVIQNESLQNKKSPSQNMEESNEVDAVDLSKNMNKSMLPISSSLLLEPAMKGDLEAIQKIVQIFLLQLKSRQRETDVNNTNSAEVIITKISSINDRECDSKTEVEYEDDRSALANFVNDRNFDLAIGGNAAIHGAVFGGHLNIVRYIIETCSGSATTLNHLGCSPLWLAAGYNHRHIVRYLLRTEEESHETQQSNLPQSLPPLRLLRAHEITQANHTGDSPLLAAASKGYYEICLDLIDGYIRNGGSTVTVFICSKNKNGDTALLETIASTTFDMLSVGDPRLCNYEGEHSTKVTLTEKYKFSENKYDEDDDDSEENQNNKNNNNNYGIDMKKRKLFTRLVIQLCHQSIINHSNSRKITPLLLACDRNLPNVVEFLFQQNQQQYQKQEQLSSKYEPSTLYSMSNSFSSITMLKNKDYKGHSPLAIAAGNGRTEVLRVLLKVILSIPPTDSDKNKTDNKSVENILNDLHEPVLSCTALWLACRGGHLDCVKLLLEGGADAKIPNKNGLTPMDIATKKATQANNKLDQSKVMVYKKIISLLDTHTTTKN